jgi:hypothetical protein
VSGGGIRSASVTLGALQVLRERLVTSRYLVSVSGGGYTTGAMRLALQPLEGSSADSTTRNAATPESVFSAGSVEEDHLRRHSNYLADGPREWVTALAVVLRGLLVSLTLMTLAVVAAGLAVGLSFSVVRLADLTEYVPKPFASGARPSFPEPTPGVVGALVLFSVAAIVVYVAALMAYVWSGRAGSCPAGQV